jgi:hypothetical protein
VELENRKVEYCGVCCFSEFSGVDNHHVLCRRYAPSPLSMADFHQKQILDANNDGYHVVATWPSVERDGWCGEFEEQGI